MFVSVIIPTYNPNFKRLAQTLAGLKAQELSYGNWELLLIDNNSTKNFADDINLDWHPDAVVMKEPEQGLTYARMKGFAAAKGDVIVMVDDDNILQADYLQQVVNIFTGNAQLGAAGGRSLPLFETKEPEWLKEFYDNLALRDLGDNIVINGWENKYPGYAPIGAGMAIRKSALSSYIKKINAGQSAISDRKGDSLTSGGDNDMVIEIAKSGWLTGYFPSLMLHHIIPAERMQPEYLARLVNNTNRSWIQLLESHHINPWNKIPVWTLKLRKLKAWFTYKAWKSDPDYIRWQGACGTFDGLAALNSLQFDTSTDQ